MAKPKLTMTLMEVYYAMREAGISISPSRISAGIACGAYPFGRVVCVGETGRRTLEVFRVDFYAWLESKTPKDMPVLKVSQHSETSLHEQIGGVCS